MGVLLPIFVCWTAIASFLPKERNLWVFGPSGRGWFVDNSKYQFLHSARNTDKRCVWVSSDLDTSTAEQLRARGYEAYHGDSWRGRYLTLRAECVFLSYRPEAALKWFVTGSRTVQLWHGNPIKQLNAPTPSWNTYLSYSYLTRAYNTWTNFVVTAEGRVRRIYQERFSLADDQILLTGYPRNDVLVRSVPDWDIGQESDIFEWASEESDQLAFYLPTWRGGGFSESHNPFHPDNFPLETVSSLLNEAGAHLLVKPHPNTDLPEGFEDTDRVVVLPDDLDIYPLLREVDVLVTDYSSILFDYLLVGNPIVLYPFDLEAYERERGFYYDYRTEMPAPIAETPQEFCEALRDAFDGRDDHREQRRELNAEVNEHGDGYAAERVVNAVLEW
jgi:CDP-glycerol glycerophosphotransferase